MQPYRDREYHAGVISIRNQLVHVFLSSTQQLDNPIDIPVSVAYQDELYDHINLVTTINKADLYPAYFDICVDTVFGAPKNLISRLLEWDKTREYQVYRIFGDHGETWHRGFANTCPKPFKTWLSSIICLEKYGSAISNNPPPDLEILIQDQKEQVKNAIQEWRETYTNDRANWGEKRAECQKIIEEDYVERELIPRIKEGLFHDIELDQ